MVVAGVMGYPAKNLHPPARAPYATASLPSINDDAIDCLSPGWWFCFLNRHCYKAGYKLKFFNTIRKYYPGFSKSFHSPNLSMMANTINSTNKLLYSG
jgi:hypothetical protein